MFLAVLCKAANLTDQEGDEEQRSRVASGSTSSSRRGASVQFLGVIQVSLAEVHDSDLVEAALATTAPSIPLSLELQPTKFAYAAATDVRISEYVDR